MVRKLNKKSWIIAKLRRASLMWPPRNEAFNKCKIERGAYECAGCAGIFKRKELHVDHIAPVVDVKVGWENWDAFIESLFCDVDGLQCLCKACHDKKSKEENENRRSPCQKSNTQRNKKK